MTKEYNTLKVGIEVYYTGDMANLPGRGKIVAVSSSEFYPVLYDIEIDNDVEKHVWKNITPASFSGIGRRFILKSEIPL